MTEPLMIRQASDRGHSADISQPTPDDLVVYALI